jgi:hypothetical protein
VPLWPVTGIASPTKRGETKKKQGNKDRERIQRKKNTGGEARHAHVHRYFDIQEKMTVLM